MPQVRRIRAGITLIVCACAVFLAGCAPSIVGKWNGNQSFPVPVTGQNINVGVSMEFKDDGTMTQDINTPLGNFSTKGTYKTEGENINYSLEAASAGGRTINLPENVRSLDGTFKVESDTLTLTGKNGNSMTLNRVKEGQ
ncbi:MAG: hypothetical protein OHK0029_03610 [Armatimonadaceae bacterium]